MSYDISGFGLQITITADTTFPAGFTVTEFSDDGDPIDIPDLEQAGTAAGLNGDLITWAKANVRKATLSVIPGSDSDANLSALAAANRPSLGGMLAHDIITLTISYPDGSTLTLDNGTITSGAVGRSTAGSGRIKTRKYAFAFEGESE